MAQDTENLQDVTDVYTLTEPQTKWLRAFRSKIARVVNAHMDERTYLNDRFSEDLSGFLIAEDYQLAELVRWDDSDTWARLGPQPGQAGHKPSRRTVAKLGFPEGVSPPEFPSRVQSMKPYSPGRRLAKDERTGTDTREMANKKALMYERYRTLVANFAEDLLEETTHLVDEVSSFLGFGGSGNGNLADGPGKESILKMWQVLKRAQTRFDEALEIALQMFMRADTQNEMEKIDNLYEELDIGGKKFPLTMVDFGWMRASDGMLHLQAAYNVDAATIFRYGHGARVAITEGGDVVSLSPPPGEDIAGDPRVTVVYAEGASSLAPYVEAELRERYRLSEHGFGTAGGRIPRYKPNSSDVIHTVPLSPLSLFVFKRDNGRRSKRSRR